MEESWYIKVRDLLVLNQLYEVLTGAYEVSLLDSPMTLLSLLTMGVVCQNLLDCILKSCHLISEIYVANVIDEVNYNADMVYNNRFIWYIVVDVFMKFQMV